MRTTCEVHASSASYTKQSDRDTSSIIGFNYLKVVELATRPHSLYFSSVFKMIEERGEIYILRYKLEFILNICAAAACNSTIQYFIFISGFTFELIYYKRRINLKLLLIFYVHKSLLFNIKFHKNQNVT